MCLTFFQQIFAEQLTVCWALGLEFLVESRGPQGPCLSGTRCGVLVTGPRAARFTFPTQGLSFPFCKMGLQDEMMASNPAQPLHSKPFSWYPAAKSMI